MKPHNNRIHTRVAKLMPLIASESSAPTAPSYVSKTGKTYPRLFASLAALGLSASTANAQWLATPNNAAFGNSTNWTGGTINGNFTGNSSITSLTVGTNDQSTSGGIVFSGATTPSYTLGASANAGNFLLFSGGSIQMQSGVSANQTINAGFIQNGSNTSNKFTSLTASSTTNTLIINGDHNTVNGSGTFIAGQSNYLALGGSGGTGVMNGIISNGRDGSGVAVLGNTLVKRTGNSTWTLNGTNTYTGGTEFGDGNTGNTVLGNKAALGTGALRVINGNANFSANTALTGANSIANTINYVSATAATTGNTYTGITAGNNTITVSVSAGTPVAGDLISGNLLGFFPNYTRVVSVSGSGVGAVLTLSNPAGSTTASATTGNTAAFNGSGAGTNTISGSNALEFSGTQNLTTLSSNNATATQTFNITNSADTIFSGVLQQQGGAAAITKTGSGRLILSANNTFTGGTTISTGTLQLGNGGTSGALSTTGAIVNNANLTINRSNAVVQGTDFSGAAISGSGNLTLAGTGTTILTVANTYTGGTTINSGSTLSLGNNGTTGSLSSTGAIVNNGTLILNRTAVSNQGTDFSSAPITGTGALVLNNVTNSFGQNNITSANSYSGTTTISNGYLQVGANSILSGISGPLGNSTTAIVLGNAGTVASPYSGSGPNVVLLVSGTGSTPFSITRNIDSTTTASVSGRNAIGFSGTGTGTLTVSGNWTLATGTGNRGSGLWAVSAGQTLDFTGIISGGNSTASLRPGDFGQGVGMVRLSNASNSYQNQTVVASGTLLIAGNATASSGVLGVNSNLVIGDFGNSATALTDGAFTVGKTITLRNLANGTNAWTLGGNTANASFFTGNINPSSFTASPTLNLSQVAGGNVTFSGVIAANPDVTNVINVAKIGGGTVILSGNNTYDGTTAISAGSLQLGNGGTTGTLPSGSAITNNANLTINRSNAVVQGTAFSSAAITGNGSFTQAGSGTTTLNAVNTYTGGTSVTGGTLIIDGSGSINGGGVTVNGGTFKNNSSVAVTPGLLTFTSGSIGGTNLSGVNLTIGAGQTISPGNSPGTMSAGATTFANGGSFLFEVNNAGGTAGSGWDLLNATSLSLTATSGGFTVFVATLVNPTNISGNADGFSPDVSKNFLFVDTDSAISSIGGVFTVNTTAVTNSLVGTWGIARGDTIVGGDATQLYVTYTVIPEPSTYAALAGLCVVGLAACRRRRLSVKAGKAA